MTESRWGVVLSGKEQDLAKWVRAFEGDLGRRVELCDGEHVLFSPSFVGLTSVDEVRGHAIRLIEVLNGVMAASSEASPLSFGALIEFTSDGRRHKRVFPRAASLVMRGFAPTVAVGHPTEPPSAPQPSKEENLALFAEGNALYADALAHFGKATADDVGGWAELYKCFECLLRVTAVPSRRKEIGKLKEQANRHRHAQIKTVDPQGPEMSFREVRNRTARLLRQP